MAALRRAQYRLRCALDDEAAAAIAAFRTQIDDPIRLGHDIQIVLDDDDRVAGIDETMQNLQQLLDVGHVQTHRRLIEHIQRVLPSRRAASRPGASVRTFASSVTSLMRWLSPPDKRRTRLTRAQVAETDIGEQLKG
jgi:hypothetical protein